MKKTNKIRLMKTKQAYPYWNPYIVGVGIGILIILSFVVTGRGLGAIGAFNGIMIRITPCREQPFQTTCPEWNIPSGIGW
jgi:hypothetical protein